MRIVLFFTFSAKFTGVSRNSKFGSFGLVFLSGFIVQISIHCPLYENLWTFLIDGLLDVLLKSGVQLFALHILICSRLQSGFFIVLLKRQQKVFEWTSSPSSSLFIKPLTLIARWLSGTWGLN